MNQNLSYEKWNSSILLSEWKYQEHIEQNQADTDDHNCYGGQYPLSFRDRL